MRINGLQPEFDQIFLRSLFLHTFIICFIYQEALGRCHHGIHLGIADKPGDRKFPVSDLHDIARRKFILCPVTDRDKDLTRPNFGKFIGKIDQIVKALPLHGQSIILCTVRQRMLSQTDLTVFQI